MLTVLIICNAGMYIWTLSFLDCCSSLSFSCTYLLNLPWSENTPLKHHLGVACRGLEGCFRVLNGGAHGLSSPLRWRQWWILKNNCTSCKILMSPGPLLWILLLDPYISRLLNVVLARIGCSLRRRDVFLLCLWCNRWEFAAVVSLNNFGLSGCLNLLPEFSNPCSNKWERPLLK